jgi:hypothetical protein
MWIYRVTKGNETDKDWIYIVGFFHPGGEFEGITDFPDEISAMRRVHYLNGGSGEELL